MQNVPKVPGISIEIPDDGVSNARLGWLQEWQVCQVTVGVLGDVCRAVEDQIAPFCDGVMQILLTNLQSDDVQRTIKPQILSCFGDIAMAIGDRFEKYLPHVLNMLQSAQVRTGVPEPLHGVAL